MPNIPVINIGGTDYNVKDEAAHTEIDELKSALNLIATCCINQKDKATLANGFVGPSGASSSSSDWRKFTLSVNAGEKISYAGGRIMTCYYDSSSGVVSGGLDSANRVETVPSGATSVTVSFEYSDIDAISVVFSDTIITISDINKAFPKDSFQVASKETENMVNRIATCYINQKDKATLTNGFVGPSGASSSSSDWRKFILSVNAGEKISCAGGRIMTCYYDSSSGVVSGGLDSANRVETVPSGATSVTVSFKYSDIDDIAVVFSDTIVTISDINKAFPKDSFQVASKETENMVNRIVVEYTNIVDGASLTVGFRAPTGGSNASEAWRYFTFSVAAGEKYSLSGGRIMTSFYKDNVSSADCITGGQDYAQGTVETVPTNANIMCVSFLYEDIDKTAVVKSDKVITIDMIGSMYPGDEYNVYSKDEIDSRLPQIVILSASPSNFRTVIESIGDSSYRKQYVVQLTTGTYAIWEMMTAEEKADETFRGIWIPKFTKLIGIEKGVIFTCEATSQKSKLSPINLDITASIENCKVTATNCRYAIHDDWTDRKWYGDGSLPDYWTEAFNNGYVRICRNVETQIVNSAVGASWGCGIENAAVWRYENCKFGRTNTYSYICHNNNLVIKSADVTFENCRCGGGSIRFSSLNKGGKTDCYAHLFGTEAVSVYLTEENVSLYDAGIRWHVDGYANTFTNEDVTIVNTDGLDYSENVDLI